MRVIRWRSNDSNLVPVAHEPSGHLPRVLPDASLFGRVVRRVHKDLHRFAPFAISKTASLRAVTFENNSSARPSRRNACIRQITELHHARLCKSVFQNTYLQVEPHTDLCYLHDQTDDDTKHSAGRAANRLSRLRQQRVVIQKMYRSVALKTALMPSDD